MSHFYFPDVAVSRPCRPSEFTLSGPQWLVFVAVNSVSFSFFDFRNTNAALAQGSSLESIINDLRKTTVLLLSSGKDF